MVLLLPDLVRWYRFAVWWQREQSMTWVAGVFENSSDTFGIEVLDGRELGPSDVMGHPH